MTFLFTFCVTFAVQSTLCLPRLFFPRVCPFSSAYDFVNGYSFADVPLCVAGSRCPVRTDYMKLPLLCVDDVFAPPPCGGANEAALVSLSLAFLTLFFDLLEWDSLRCAPPRTCSVERTTLFSPLWRSQRLYAAPCAAIHATISVARSASSLSMYRPAVVCFPPTSRPRVARHTRRLFSFSHLFAASSPLAAGFVTSPSGHKAILFVVDAVVSSPCALQPCRFVVTARTSTSPPS